MIRAAVASLSAEILTLSGRLGRAVVVDQTRVGDRSDDMPLHRPGVWSANRSCRMVRALDGWIAVNLPRADDRWLVPAWTGCGLAAEPWAAIRRAARRGSSKALVSDGQELGLPVAGVGEVCAARPAAVLHRMGAGRPLAERTRLRVLDLSSLWAGPLCGGLLAEAGLATTKLESEGRPDVMRQAGPRLYGRLNDRKSEARLDFTKPDHVRRLGGLIAETDVLITGARPRAFEQLGLSPQWAFAANPGLVWVAITGYGWTGDGALRVAFGDDAAAAGGLVRWTPSGAPRFAGDALADPVTGLAAAAGALEALLKGGGYLVDAALARTAAGAAALAGAA